MCLSKRILRRSLPVAMIWGLLGGVLVLMGCSPTPSVGPNVVLISIDTLRADHVGLYGYARPTTPNIDGFFDTGSVFDNAMTSAPCTIPAVRQLLAGAFDHSPNRKQLPEFFREQGYRTAAIVSQQQFHRHPVEAYTRGFGHFDIQAPEEVDHHGSTARRAEGVSDRAIQWLGKHANEGRFFLWLHYFDPHDPYEPPGGFRSFDRGNGSERSGDRRTYLREARRPEPTSGTSWQWGGGIFTDEDVAHFINLYDGEIAYTDAQVGRVLAFLEENHLTEKTIVVLTADHGEWLGERDRWDHCGTLHDVEVRVPFMVLVNGRPLGSVAAETLPASTLDILPTLLGLLEIDFPASDYHGEDLRGAASDRTTVAMWGRKSVIRDHEWKLSFENGSPAALHQLQRDKEERWNRLEDEPEVVDRLRGGMERFRAISMQVQLQDEQTIRELESLGYIER